MGGMDRTKDQQKDWRMGGCIKDGTMNQNRRMEGRHEGWDMWKKDRKDK